MEFKAGSLVNVRNRDWVVLPSPDKDLVRLKPLGGSEEEITGIYLPLAFPEDKIRSTSFKIPSGKDLGDFSSSLLLYNATRLSFRNGAGPFRSLAKLSFRPRPYQMVPLIMALRQSKAIRLLIADDVGVGKTIEALLILKEYLERREIKRFAIITPPHLCDQWQNELKDKFGIDAVVIRSNTQAKLDREIHGDASVYDYYPFQVISIDYIKSDQRRQVFIHNCPELVIVDEVHTCTSSNLSNSGQQQRHQLIKDVAANPDRHMIYLTATPHSGKSGQFQSLLGLLKPEFADIDLALAERRQREEIAKFFVQRRRAHVESWMKEDTPFPKRDTGEFQYSLSPEYEAFYGELLKFTLGITPQGKRIDNKERMKYWSALTLLRGVMSSPAAGLEMLSNRIKKHQFDDEPEQAINPLIKGEFEENNDYAPLTLISRPDWTSSEKEKLTELTQKIGELQGIEKDLKIEATVEIIKSWLKSGFQPVVFCRFIATAKYVGDVLKREMNKEKKLDIQVVTSEDPDEVRRARVEEMGFSEKRLLIATDCLSEGINLQESFSAVLHYDLPWNPNRLEQREGRVDRFGQKKDEVKGFLLYGRNNPIDGVVLNILLKKVREIRKSIGITIPFPEDSESLLDAVMQAVLAEKEDKENVQLDIDSFLGETAVQQSELKATRAIDQAAEREKAIRNIFAQMSIKAAEIEQDLRISDEAIGDPATVENFVINALHGVVGAQVDSVNNVKGYRLVTDALPPSLLSTLPEGNPLRISFFSPTPEGYVYLGRNHLFVEQLCQHIMAEALTDKEARKVSRAAVIRSKEVTIKTTILLFRVRNVIEERRSKNQLVAEEMLVWGYRGAPDEKDYLSKKDAMSLLKLAIPSSSISEQTKASFLDSELPQVEALRKDAILDDLALERSRALVESHDRFQKVLGGSRYKEVEPVLPMDLIGLYILLPEIGTASA